MKKEQQYGIVGLIIGVILTSALAVVINTNKQADSSMTMSDMVRSLQNKSGDDFDKAFIAGMIEHHQGAIDMARLVKDKAKHEELKTMAGNITSTQSKEIDMMQTWQSDWGYKTTPKSHDSMNR